LVQNTILEPTARRHGGRFLLRSATAACWLHLPGFRDRKTKRVFSFLEALLPFSNIKSSRESQIQKQPFLVRSRDENDD
jgi:hypothetical protein